MSIDQNRCLVYERPAAIDDVKFFARSRHGIYANDHGAFDHTPSVVVLVSVKVPLPQGAASVVLVFSAVGGIEFIVVRTRRNNVPEGALAEDLAGYQVEV